MTTLRQLLTDRNTAFQISDVDEVVDFLRANPPVWPLVNEAVPHIREKFGRDMQLELAILPDESRDGPGTTQLLLKVWVNLDVEQAHARRKEFCFNWWLAACHKADNKLTIGLRYNKPAAS